MSMHQSISSLCKIYGVDVESSIIDDAMSIATCDKHEITLKYEGNVMRVSAEDAERYIKLGAVKMKSSIDSLYLLNNIEVDADTYRIGQVAFKIDVGYRHVVFVTHNSRFSLSYQVDAPQVASLVQAVRDAVQFIGTRSEDSSVILKEHNMKITVTTRTLTIDTVSGTLMRLTLT